MTSMMSSAMIGSSLRYGAPSYGIPNLGPTLAPGGGTGTVTGTGTGTGVAAGGAGTAPNMVGTAGGMRDVGTPADAVAVVDQQHNEAENDGGVRNGRMFLLYFFVAFVIVRLWMLVAEQDNDVYTGLAIVAMTLGLLAYCRWRNHRWHLYENDLNVAFPHHNQHDFREIPAETVQQFLAIQAALRRAATDRNNRVIPTEEVNANAEHHARMLFTSELIASLPSIVYIEGGVSRPVSPRATGIATLPGTSGEMVMSSAPNRVDADGGLRGDLESGDHRDMEGTSPRRSKPERERDTLCMVCLADFVALDITTVLPCACGHRYHRDCIAVWLTRKNTCPLCCVQLSLPPSVSVTAETGAAHGMGREGPRATTQPQGRTAPAIGTTANVA